MKNGERLLLNPIEKLSEKVFNGWEYIGILNNGNGIEYKYYRIKNIFFLT